MLDQVVDPDEDVILGARFRGHGVHGAVRQGPAHTITLPSASGLAAMAWATSTAAA